MDKLITKVENVTFSAKYRTFGEVLRFLMDYTDGYNRLRTITITCAK